MLLPTEIKFVLWDLFYLFFRHASFSMLLLICWVTEYLLKKNNPWKHYAEETNLRIPGAKSFSEINPNRKSITNDVEHKNAKSMGYSKFTSTPVLCK